MLFYTWTHWLNMYVFNKRYTYRIRSYENYMYNLETRNRWRTNKHVNWKHNLTTLETSKNRPYSLVFVLVLMLCPYSDTSESDSEGNLTFIHLLWIWYSCNRFDTTVCSLFDGKNCYCYLFINFLRYLLISCDFLRPKQLSKHISHVGLAKSLKQKISISYLNK